MLICQYALSIEGFLSSCLQAGEVYYKRIHFCSIVRFLFVLGRDLHCIPKQLTGNQRRNHSDRISLIHPIQPKRRIIVQKPQTFHLFLEQLFG